MTILLSSTFCPFHGTQQGLKEIIFEDNLEFFNFFFSWYTALKFHKIQILDNCKWFLFSAFACSYCGSSCETIYEACFFNVHNSSENIRFSYIIVQWFKAAPGKRDPNNAPAKRHYSAVSDDYAQLFNFVFFPQIFPNFICYLLQ